MKNKRFSVIGAGSLGTHFMASLVKKDYRLNYIYKKVKFENHPFASAVTGDIGKMVQRSDFIIISTQESKIREAAEFTAISSRPAGKIFFHTSNSLTSDELLSLKKKGAYTASFSPLQTFAGFDGDPSTDLFKGIYFLLEGDEEAVKRAEEIAGDLNARVIPVAKNEKIYFHIAAVCASNFLISILKLSESQLKKVGPAYNINVLLPLIKQTLENVASRGVEASLTGPFKRKESAIIRKHLELLEKAPDEAALYKALTEFLGKGGKGTVERGS